MNSKERVRAALARERVDKIPLGFYVVDYDTIERVIGHETYVRAKVKSRIALWEGRRDEVVESYKKDTVEFYRKIDLCDLICFNKEAPLVPPKGYVPEDPPRQVSEDVWRDARGRVYKISHETDMIRIVEDPTVWGTEYTVEQFQADIEDVPPDPSIFEAIDYVLAELGQERYMAGEIQGYAMALLGNMERGLLEYALHPQVVKAAIDYHRRRQNTMDKYYIRPGQDAVLYGEDTSGTRGPLISPQMYREFCYPALRSRIQNVKSFGMQVILHDCGDNRSLLPMWVEAGVDAYQSIQTYIEDLAALQEEWGHAMTFWGGVPVEMLLEGTVDEVRRSVRQTMAQAGPRGGFILGPSHSIPYGTKYDNFMAMLDEFDACREKYA